MKRRNFFRFITLLLSPTLAGATAAPVRRLQLSTPRQIPPPIPSSDDPLLNAWLQLPMQPILRIQDVSSTLPDEEREMATTYFTLMHEGVQEFEFAYHGGSEPGATRRVLPILLFQKITPDTGRSGGCGNPIYLLSFCRTRNAPRTFRLDRMGSLSPLKNENIDLKV